MKKYMLFFCIIFVILLMIIFTSELMLDKNKHNNKFILYKTNINTVYFTSIKLDKKNSSETIRLSKTEYDNSIWDIGFEVLEENMPADFKYNGVLKLMVFDEEKKLIMFKEITSFDRTVFSDKDLTKLKIATFYRGVFKISGDYVDLALSVEKEDRHLSKYHIRYFFGSIVTP